jgi:hypothetical protein
MSEQDKMDALNILKRMECRVDNMRLEFKRIGNSRKHDMDTMLEQIKVLRRFVGQA